MVTHTSWLFLADSSLRQRLLEDLDCLTLLLAAACHDLEHPGTTNAYQVNTGSALAIRYNDASVLENHHCCCCFALLERSRILANLSSTDYKNLRRTMVSAILATDSACSVKLRACMCLAALTHAWLCAAVSAHKTLLASVSARMAGDAPAASAGAAPPPGELAVGGAGAGFERYNPDHRQLLTSFLLHCADLCNPLLPPPISRRIAADLSREFAAQAELERAAGLPITVMLASDEVSRAKLEVSNRSLRLCAALCFCGAALH
jgi:hypothetical protein